MYMGSYGWLLKGSGLNSDWLTSRGSSIVRPVSAYFKLKNEFLSDDALDSNSSLFI